MRAFAGVFVRADDLLPSKVLNTLDGMETEFMGP